ncbi:MAG: AI-2E family transporter, partial [Firmicutes bacterium]|nr:AI-2E family transporter [Bacillota bacterium]
MNGLNRTSRVQLYKRLTIRFFIAVIIAAFVFFGLPKLIKLLLPFVFALVGAAIINPLAERINRLGNRINKNIKIPRKITTLVLNILVLFLVLLLIYFVTYNVIKEAISLANNILRNWSSIVRTYDEFLDKLTPNISVMPQSLIDILQDVKDSVLVFVQNISKNIVSFTVSTTTSRITSTGTLLINLITFFLALFFLGFDYY